ncbi:TipAS antibiotic-recognition domain-containing protein [Paenibacillus sp. 19GGS1-52]|uniref:TipAS antibiotic-recognition domain-containing protein n=1 Tax=Paenibacillus sp. 19GGS1-52 TaxID=2758563 RepID=UPI0023BB14E8|nr:TipAS antibiotic-recognition domain-containing protein [Paenibacillus sp. 19GGS1-52]
MKQSKSSNRLYEKIRNYMQQGIPATNKEVQSLAKQWQNLVEMFAPKNDPEFMKSAEKFHIERVNFF